MRQRLRDWLRPAAGAAGAMGLKGKVYRAAAPSDDDLARAAERTKKEPGRFNTKAFGAVYLSRDPETALAELKKNAGGKVDSCLIYLAEIDVSKVADLTDAAECAHHGLTAEDLTCEDVSRCQSVAATLFESGYEAVVWPSAAGAGHSLAVYLDNLERKSRLMLVGSYEAGLKSGDG